MKNIKARTYKDFNNSFEFHWELFIMHMEQALKEAKKTMSILKAKQQNKAFIKALKTKPMKNKGAQ